MKNSENTQLENLRTDFRKLDNALELKIPFNKAYELVFGDVPSYSSSKKFLYHYDSMMSERVALKLIETMKKMISDK